MNKYFILLFCAVIISVISQLLLKKSVENKYNTKLKEYINFWVISAYFLLFFSTLLVILAYKHLEYKNGAVIESISYPLILILSKFIFKEKLTVKKIIGNLLIILGVFVFYS